jgi:equilibrative nucleoside transporter 1/2/3
MDSPSKSEKLVPALQDEEGLEIGRDGMPQEIWDDMVKNERKIFYMFMFLNGSVLWAYYSCLSAQDFYEVQFADSGMDFSFLTTLFTSWPMVIGHGLQMFLGLDKKITRQFRVHVGYGIFIIMAILIMVFSAIDFSSQRTGAVLVLVCFACIGFGNSLTEATYYTFAALFPIPKFSQAVQIGNGTAGIFNITLATILRLAVGGVRQTGDSTKLAFYLFFGLLIVVLIAALFVYYRLMSLPCVKYLLKRNEESSKAENLAAQPVSKTCSNLWRIFCIIWVPALAQFLVFFVSLTVYPGFGCAAARNLEPPYSSVVHTITENWYCSPGIVGSYNYGDFFGRVFTGAAVYKLLNSEWCLGLSVLRLGFIPLLLLGVAGTSLYSFGFDDMGAIAYNIVLNLIIGVTNGFLSTVTMGVAPRMLKPEDRESGGAVMVFCLFFGLSTGSTLGFFFSDQGWLGL